MEVSKTQFNSSKAISKVQNKGDYALVQRLVIFSINRQIVNIVGFGPQNLNSICSKLLL